MKTQIYQSLGKLFGRHRIVFWYDNKKELRNDFEALQLPDVEKIELANNEYGVKYRILCKEPNQKFLLYKEGAAPADLDNWLLDVQLANGEFRADQAAIWLSELDLGLEFVSVVQEHMEFFRAGKRIENLKKLIKSDDTMGQIRLKMLAVCVGGEPRIDVLLENMLQELANHGDEKVKLINRCKLNGFLWEQMKRHYGYESEEPSIKDFVVSLFKDSYFQNFDDEFGKTTNHQSKTINQKSPIINQKSAIINQKSPLSSDALVFLKRWKDSRSFEDSFETLSEECATVLGIEQDLNRRDFRDLLEIDYFRLIDQKIISDLVKEVLKRTVSSADVGLWVRTRRQGHWYKEYEDLYEALDFAAQFMSSLNEANLNMESLVDGVHGYTNFWYLIDQLYRKFIYHVRKSGQASLMNILTEQIENLYSNNYLLKLGDRFQTFVDSAKKWQAPPVYRQDQFYDVKISQGLSKDSKICVIISDAMRYEVGVELASLIRQENRFDAEIEPMLSMLPSYTQLGMAALLPHKKLEIADNETGTVLVDGQSSKGTANRIKILKAGDKQRATAHKADEIMALSIDDCRALVREHDLIYVYHNRIDATGDKRETEERVFEAVEDTFQELVKLVKKLANANVNNMFITSDHGFIYQNRAIDESDFAGEDAKGKEILVRDRRFVLGKGLAKASSLHSFTSQSLGLSGKIEALIPKSINRLRLKGAGSRFVHGGASLQEVVVPLIKVNKKRQNDVSVVGVEILRGANQMITSGQLGVTMYQSAPVTDKVQARVLRAGIYTEAGELVSDCQELNFDLRSENPRERELQVRFVLSNRANEVNGQEVILRLEEKHVGTSYFKEYKSVRYLMRRSFLSDFDF